MIATVQGRGKKSPRGFGKHCPSSFWESLQSHERKQTTGLLIAFCVATGLIRHPRVCAVLLFSAVIKMDYHARMLNPMQNQNLNKLAWVSFTTLSICTYSQNIKRNFISRSLHICSPPTWIHSPTSTNHVAGEKETKPSLSSPVNKKYMLPRQVRPILLTIPWSTYYHIHEHLFSPSSLPNPLFV